MSWIGFVLRWFHLIAVITLVGGTIFMRLALVPAVAVLADEQRQSLHQQIRSRWAKLIMASIAFLLLTGLANFIVFMENTKSWEGWRDSYGLLYNLVFGMKFMLALVIFFIASALAGREATKKFRQDAKWWMTVNLAPALTVVALSGVLRMTHTGPNPPVQRSAGESSAGGVSAVDAAAPAPVGSAR